MVNRVLACGDSADVAVGAGSVSRAVMVWGGTLVRDARMVIWCMSLR
jgi:hypothetical protein